MIDFKIKGQRTDMLRNYTLYNKQIEFQIYTQRKQKQTSY